MPHKVVTIKRWEIVASFLAVTLAFVAGLWLVQHDNNARIHDIQQSRIASCRHTYEGVRQVFRPFFRPAAVRTAKERRDIRKFNRIIDRLERRCDLQTRVRKT